MPATESQPRERSKRAESVASNSAHEPQNATADFQQLVHFEVHGRNARKKFGVVLL
jgi:hypothetical protein